MYELTQSRKRVICGLQYHELLFRTNALPFVLGTSFCAEHQRLSYSLNNMLSHGRTLESVLYARASGPDSYAPDPVQSVYAIKVVLVLSTTR
jgi:hypothetical protein